MKKSSLTPMKALVVLLLAVLLLPILSGCESMLIDNGLHRSECEAFVNALMANDYPAAQAVAPTILTNDKKSVFDTCRQSFEGATSYELTQTGWNINTTNGVTTRTAAYQIELDTGKICQLTLQTTENVEGIAFINFRDSSEFIESTKNVGTVNIVLLAISIVVMAFTVWMLVDAIRRKMAKKALWIILILLSLSLSFTTGPASVNNSFMVTLFLTPSSYQAVIPNETLTLTVVLPIGSLIYFFLRKKLTAQYEAKMALAAAAAEAATAATAAATAATTAATTTAATAASPLTAADFPVQASAAPATSDAVSDAAPVAEDATAPAAEAPAEAPAEETPETPDQP